MSPLHVGVCGPVAGQDIAALMGMEPQALPRGYEGAPLLVTLIEGLLARGHRVSVFTLSNDLSFAAGAVKVASRLHPGLALHFCPLRRHAWRPCEGRPGRILDLYRHERRALVEAMRQAAPAVIHAHWAYEFAWAALDTGIPTVVTCHDSPLLVARMNVLAKPTISLYRGLRVLMAWQVLRRARWVTAVSPYLAAALEGMSPRPLQVIPNPVDGRSLVLGRDRQLGQELRIALVSNGFDRRKNPKKALLAFARLWTSRPQARLHLFGRGFEADGEAAAWCRSRRDLADCLPAMSFHGPLGHAELLERLAACDLLIHPALEETFGMVLAEAMALGLPVVAGRHSGAVPWVVGEDACLCDVRDPGAIASAALEVLVPERYAALSMQLRRTVRERFGLDAVISSYGQVYHAARKGERESRGA
ncbi:glycosyltransferase family 4 protein [Roseateles flavus]|uniref:Glycosyltransferase family 4 protein n=1 Tax=Roseateles flavus TaxID=3149041 RepID=A0ABV0GAN2_9BURK